MEPDATELTLIGRSSSLFTRVARIFGSEFEVTYTFQLIADLGSRDAHDYGGNPALKMPALETREGVWFGTLNICRELRRRSAKTPLVVWPEELAGPLLNNAHELVTQAMATEVSWIMAKISSDGHETAHQTKMRLSLENTLSWLERNVDDALAALPKERDLSYSEVALYCLLTHLEFREVLSVAPYARLSAFRDHFGARASAIVTPYRFDM